ncbi:hypothetical protein M8818_001013 [Zalaria obscura]|uniref:Uncharacterized protein n=1 Tax=Zalaria obscura TaxID=2024903 RepID=A0ACC3SPG6_9PEZI
MRGGDAVLESALKMTNVGLSQSNGGKKSLDGETIPKSGNRAVLVSRAITRDSDHLEAFTPPTTLPPLLLYISTTILSFTFDTLVLY